MLASVQHLGSGSPGNLQVLGAFHGVVSSYFLSQDFMGAFNASVNAGHGIMTPRGPRGSLISACNALEIMETLFSTSKRVRAIVVRQLKLL